MHDRPLTRDDLLHLIGEASARAPEAGERLRWLLHFSESRSVSATCRAFGISRSTFYRWYHRFDPLDLSTLEDVPVVPPSVTRLTGMVTPLPSDTTLPAPAADPVLPEPAPSPRAEREGRALLFLSLLGNLALIGLLFAMLASQRPVVTGIPLEASVSAASNTDTTSTP